MPVFPGSEPVELRSSADLVVHGFRELRLNMSTHTGTHIDFGFHIHDRGSNAETVPLTAFYGKAMVIDCRHQIRHGFIPVSCLHGRENEIKNTDFVLLYTGWSRFWGTGEYFKDFPVLDPDGAAYLSGFRLKGIGIDAAGFDEVASFELPVHRLLLLKGIHLVENLCQLDLLPRRDFDFCCFPLKINNGDGSPVRAVGILKSDG